jgi:hypothetical protein
MVRYRNGKKLPEGGTGTKMTSINTGLNPYAQLGSAYARAAAPQSSLADALSAVDSGNQPDTNAATNLTLSAAARAQLASATTLKDFTTVTSDARSALDGLYTAANVKGPISDEGATTIDLSSFDRRSLFAIATNNGGKFSPDEQKVASTELANRYNDALAPAAATSKLISMAPAVRRRRLPRGRCNAPRCSRASRPPSRTRPPRPQASATIRSPLILRKTPPAAPRRPRTSQLSRRTFAPRSTRRRRLLPPPARNWCSTPAAKPVNKQTSVHLTALAAISLNQNGLFSKQESFAAKQTLDSRARASILSALKQSQSSGDPTQLSLGILNTCSSISVEERQAINWTPAFRDSLVANYKSSSQILSILRG